MEDLDLHTIDNWRKWLRGVSAHYGFETWDSGPWVFFRKGKEIPPCEELQRVWDESDGKQVHPFCAKCYKIFLQPKLEPTLEKFVKTVYSTLSTLSDRNVIGKIRIPYTPDFYKDPSSEKLVVYSYGRKEMWENIRKLYGNMDSQELGSDVPAPYAKAIYNRYT
ncbi:MAG TPA: hypothetical protein VJ343_01375, partial [archaeon]|nr:hypothetical protein [archaeon]